MPSVDEGVVEELIGHTRAMASDITVRAPLHQWSPGRNALQQALDDALAVFGAVERECTRFASDSPLMQANAQPDQWHSLPRYCHDALVEAFFAYLDTGGLFDPRILDDLVRLGYDKSLRFDSGESQVVCAPPSEVRAGDGQWAFRTRGADEIHLGGRAVDLGGIGKGLAVRWACERITKSTHDFLVDAGGDCYAAGRAADGDLWRIGVEDPLSDDGLIAVLALTDKACTTSSIRLRHWLSGQRRVHHLIDPRTGEPGGQGLMAVTVVANDPAAAEVASKALFLAGAAGIESAADARDMAALWVTEDGALHLGKLMERHVRWLRS